MLCYYPKQRAELRFYKSEVLKDVLYYEDFMKEKSYFKGVPPNLPPKGSRCDGCPYWHGIGCVFCYREQLKPKTGGKHEP